MYARALTYMLFLKHLKHNLALLVRLRSAGTTPVNEHIASSSCSEDDALVALMPHLAHCLTSPSLSRTSSPVREQQQQQQRATSDQQEGYRPAELVAAVEFHLQMFPNLKREVHRWRLGWKWLVLEVACRSQGVRCR